MCPAPGAANSTVRLPEALAQSQHGLNRNSAQTLNPADSLPALDRYINRATRCLASFTHHCLSFVHSAVHSCSTLTLVAGFSHVTLLQITLLWVGRKMKMIMGRTLYPELALNKSLND